MLLISFVHRRPLTAAIELKKNYWCLMLTHFLPRFTPFQVSFHLSTQVRVLPATLYTSTQMWSYLSSLGKVCTVVYYWATRSRGYWPRSQKHPNRFIWTPDGPCWVAHWSTRDTSWANSPKSKKPLVDTGKQTKQSEWSQTSCLCAYCVFH